MSTLTKITRESLYQGIRAALMDCPEVQLLNRSSNSVAVLHGDLSAVLTAACDGAERAVSVIENYYREELEKKVEALRKMGERLKTVEKGLATDKDVETFIALQEFGKDRRFLEAMDAESRPVWVGVARFARAFVGGGHEEILNELRKTLVLPNPFALASVERAKCWSGQIEVPVEDIEEEQDSTRL